MGALDGFERTFDVRGEALDGYPHESHWYLVELPIGSVVVIAAAEEEEQALFVKIAADGWTALAGFDSPDPIDSTHLVNLAYFELAGSASIVWTPSPVTIRGSAAGA